MDGNALPDKGNPTGNTRTAASFSSFVNIPKSPLLTLSSLLHKIRPVSTKITIRTLYARLRLLSYMRSHGLFCVASQNTRKIHRCSRCDFRFDNDNRTCYPKTCLLLFCHYTIFFYSKWWTSLVGIKHKLLTECTLLAKNCVL